MIRKKSAAKKNDNSHSKFSWVKSAGSVELSLLILILILAVNLFVRGKNEITESIVPDGDFKYQEPPKTDYGAWILDPTSNMRQRRDYDCGPAALAMALSVLRDNVDQSFIAEKAGTAEQGTSMLGLYRFLKERGYETFGMKDLKIEDIRQLKHPSVAHISGGHYVTILNQKEGQLLIFDPLWGKVLVTESDFADLWGGILLTIGKKS